MAPDVQRLSERMGMTYDETFVRLKRQYDGYHFTEPSPDIYNPFSLLNAFASGLIKSYWFGSGAPTSLIELVRSYGWQITDPRGAEHPRGRLRRSHGVDGVAASHALPSWIPHHQGRGPAHGRLHARHPQPGGEPRTWPLPCAPHPHRAPSSGTTPSSSSSRAPCAPTTWRARSSRCVPISPAFPITWGVGTSAALRPRSTSSSTFSESRWRLSSRQQRGAWTPWSPQATRSLSWSSSTGRPAAEALAQIDDPRYLLPFSAGEKNLVKVGVSFSPEEQTIDDWIIAPA